MASNSQSNIWQKITFGVVTAGVAMITMRIDRLENKVEQLLISNGTCAVVASNLSSRISSLEGDFKQLQKDRKESGSEVHYFVKPDEITIKRELHGKTNL